MEYVIAVFRARTDTINFTNILRSYSVPVSIINTPRQINVSCGISAKFDYHNLDKAKNIISRRRFDSFAGFYYVRGFGGGMTTRKL